MNMEGGGSCWPSHPQIKSKLKNENFIAIMMLNILHGLPLSWN